MSFIFCCVTTCVRSGVTNSVNAQNHGLYGSTSCRISQWERAIFDPHSHESPQPIFIKFELYNYFPDTTQHAKFQGIMSTWVVWANSQFDAWQFLSFFLSSSRPQVASLHSLDTSPHSIRHASFLPWKYLLGLAQQFSKITFFIFAVFDVRTAIVCRR